MPQNSYLPWLLLILAYFLGSIPIGWLVGKLFYKIDIRKGGSGNIGATNALRLFGTTTGVIVLLLDMVKGFTAVLIAQAVLPEASPFIALTALTVMLGHIFPVWLGFKGGKGVATAAGAVIALTPLSVVVALCIFVIVVALTRYVSLGSLLAALGFWLHGIWVTSQSGKPDYAKLALITLMVLMIVITHRSNIKRLLSGSENRIRFSKQGNR